MQKGKEMTNIKVLEELAEDDPRLPFLVEEMARIFGLGVLDFDKPVSINKMSAIYRNPNGMPNQGHIMSNAYVQVVGNEDGFIWLYAQSGFNWFKTSPIVDVTVVPDEKGLVVDVETENSIYRLYQS